MTAAIGVDIGGSYIKAVAVDAAGRCLARRDAPTPEARGALVSHVRELVAALGAAGPVGIACPGLAARDNRRIAWMRGRLDCIEGLDWADALALPHAVCVLNDAHAAAIGEAWCGAAARLRHVVLLTLGTGVGGGAIVDGRIVQGAIGRGGHLGHIVLERDGARDIANTPGSLEDLVGDHTVAARSGGRFRDTASLCAAAAAGDAGAAQVWDRSVQALACGLASLINAFDPEAVIVGGGIARAGAQLFDPLRRYLDEYEWRPLGTGVPVLPAALGDAAGAIGAARFAMTREGGGNA